MNSVEAMLFCTAVGNICVPMETEIYSEFFYSDYVTLLMKHINPEISLEANRA